MKKSLAFLSGICLALSSGLASAVTLNGWNVGNPTPVGATGLVNATKNVGGVAKVSNASIIPNASQVSKILRGGVAGVALTVAVNELLDGIDWVMDPANNQIKYKEPVSTFCVWSDSYCGSTPYEACKAYGQIVSGGWKYNSVTGYCDTWNRDGETTNHGINISGELKDKTLPLDTASQKVIDNAQAGNTDAQVATVAAAQDILNEAQNDAEKAKPIVQQLEDNSTNADPNNPDPDDEKPVNDGKQSKKMNEKQIGELVGNKNWHNTPLKKKIVKTYSKELRGSNNFDFYKDPKTGEIFIKGNKSKEMILINLEKFL
ncbi:hypothetical protein J0904_02295 [Acinetobacter bereziniae]|uniref:hypothetical protein n=1 Tax=Acinetobacter bereziniae TaxID=106648 RepID=UPI0020760FE9|nr:hypothetical protein [Acinetobacter bereziniae]MCM8510918.1 hypothetical protein [Acinetobacter bereziniae]